MKNKPNLGILYLKYAKKIFLIMKISFLLLFVTVFSAYSTSIFSQNATVSINMQNATVREVVSEIERQVGISFLFNDNLTGLNQRVNVSFTDQPIKHVLENALSQADMTYEEIKDDFVVLLPKPDNLMKQQITVSGTVSDAATGEPLPGASVVLKGTTTGTVTDIDGRYIMSVPGPDAVIVFSFIGYLTQEIVIGEQTEIKVSLSEDILGLDEVVVVGYGTQRAGAITGSISRVKAEDMARVTTPTVSQSLQGMTSGVFIKNKNAQPGENKTEINIRGFGTPLIIVDGNPVSQTFFQELDPNDIDQMNILKDAAAASVYGARAGNGVIIVRTKRGRLSEPQFSFKSEATAQFLLPNAIFHMPNAHEVMSAKNFMDYNAGIEPTWSPELIELHRKYADGSNPEYPNVNMLGEVYKKYTPMYQNVLSVRGGSERVKYYLSGGWLNQAGVERSNNTQFDRYSLRSNVDVAITERLNLGFDLSYNFRNFIGPRNQMEGRNWNFGQSTYIRARRWNPAWSIDPLPNPDFLTGAPGGTTINPINAIYIDNVGYNSWNSHLRDLNINLSYDLPFGLSTGVRLGYRGDSFDFKQYQKMGPEYNYNPVTEQYSHVRNINRRNELTFENERRNDMNLQYSLDWRREFAGRHNFTGLIVAEYLTDNYIMFNAMRHDFDVDIDQLFAGPSEYQYNNSRATEGGRVGYIGRLSYNYAGKYTLEANSRLDGSPLFPPDKRWGFFPSFSASWLISEEPFLREGDLFSFLNSLRLRASYGKLGYDGAGRFQYLSTFGFSGSYIPSGTTLQRGIRADAIANPNITWETMDLANIGIEFIIWDGQLGGSVDVFQRDRKSVLGTRIRDIPDIVGARMPQENYQEFQNRGIEFSLDHNNSVGDIRYTIGGNVSYNQQKIVFTDQPEFANKEMERRNTQIGRYVGHIWMWPSDGLFQTQEEIDNWADIDGRNNATIQLGDVRYIDTNGDGRITAEDMIIGGHGRMPRLNYGFNSSLSWKGFDFFMLWQGASHYWINSRASELVSNPGGNALQHHLDHYYVPEGNEWLPANTDARFPRIRSGSAGGGHRSYRNNLQHWWIDGTYLRLRQLQLSYSLPEHLASRVGANNIRISVAGYNLLTFFTLDFMDPEIDESPIQGLGNYHPQMGSYNFGVEINF